MRKLLEESPDCAKFGGLENLLKAEREYTCVYTWDIKRDLTRLETQINRVRNR